ncbi:hypothetical protein SKAU_G00276320 [Synaphobranchus kaupii]|uniref:Uncharacterized protein n=1 Tax=Synaphobranchus kaupii TaxID=118154 RepID=A0A9Q1F1C7_SYNKA|nr:hypothetical protein SKAU_G00276320 [Synaphobranchus kaupii]
MFGLKEVAEGSRPLLDFVHDKLPQWLGLSPDKSFTLERVHPETIRQRREFNGAKKLFLDMGTFRGFHLHLCKLRVLQNGKIQLFASPREAEEFHRRTSAS